MWGNISLWFWFVFPWWSLSNTEQLFLCHLAICMSFLKKRVYSDILPTISIYLYLSAWVLWILDINYLSDTSFINIFTNSVGSLFILLIASFNVQMHFSWWPLFFHFCFCFPCLRRHIQKKNIAKTSFSKYTAYIFMKSFMVLCIIFI